MIDLISDFSNVAAALPESHRCARLLAIVEKALIRDAEFLSRHLHHYPQALFQCIWNRCRLSDVDSLDGLFGERFGVEVSRVLDEWRSLKERTTPGFAWVRSLRPSDDSPLSDLRFAVRDMSAPVTCSAFSPDGAYVSWGMKDGTWHERDVRTAHGIRNVAAHEGAITAIGYLPNRDEAVTAGRDGYVRQWDRQTGELLAEFLEEHDSIPDAWKALLSNSGRHRSPNPTIGAEFRRLDADIGTTVFSPDGRFVLLASRPPVYDDPSPLSVNIRPHHWVEVRELESAVDSSRPFGWDYSATVSRGSPVAIAVSIGHPGWEISGWDTRNGERLWALGFAEDFDPPRVRLAPFGKYAAIIEKRFVRVLDALDGTLIDTYRLGRTPGNCAFSSDARLLLILEGDALSSLIVLDRKVRLSVTGFGLLLRRSIVAYKGDDDTLAASAGSNDDQSAEEVGSPHRGAFVISGNDVVRLETDGGRKTIFSDVSPIRFVTSTSDESLIAVGLNQGLKLIDARSCVEIQDLQVAGPVHVAAFSPDSKYLAAIDDDAAGGWRGGLRIWSVDRRRRIARRDIGRMVMGLAFNSDGTVLYAYEQVRRNQPGYLSAYRVPDLTPMEQRLVLADAEEVQNDSGLQWRGIDSDTAFFYDGSGGVSAWYEGRLERISVDGSSGTVAATARNRIELLRLEGYAIEGASQS